MSRPGAGPGDRRRHQGVSQVASSQPTASRVVYDRAGTVVSSSPGKKAVELTGSWNLAEVSERREDQGLAGILSTEPGRQPEDGG